MNREQIKEFLKSNQNLLGNLYNLLNIFNTGNIKSNTSNDITYSHALLQKSSILSKKRNNIIHILPGSYLNKCSISVYGSNNKVIIGENCRLKDVEIHIEDDNNEIIIGRGTTIAGFTHLACIEGTRITIGEDCMFSKDITFRTGDSHSIIDEKNGLRINPSEDIIIGNHVWIGNKVIVTKGGVVGDNSIIGTGSIVTNEFDKSNIIVAGSPAKIVKEGINWLRKRI